MRDTTTKNKEIAALEARILQLEQKAEASYYISRILKQFTDHTYFQNSKTSVKNISYHTLKGTAYGLMIGLFFAACLYTMSQYEKMKEDKIKEEKRAQREIYCSDPENRDDCRVLNSIFDPKIWVATLDAFIEALSSRSFVYEMWAIYAAVGLTITGAGLGLSYGIFSEVRRGIQEYNKEAEKQNTLDLN